MTKRLRVKQRYYAERECVQELERERLELDRERFNLQMRERERILS